MAATTSDITGLLQKWTAGDEAARNELMPLIYERLRRLAHERLRNAPGEASLNTTDLVHETYLRLMDAPQLSFADRAHFLALTAQIMRNLLIDRVRARAAQRRGGGAVHLELQEELWITDAELDVFEDLDEALNRLRELNPRQSQLLQHRYFGGLSLEESAAALNVSLATAKRDLRLARAWLALELNTPSSL